MSSHLSSVDGGKVMHLVYKAQKKKKWGIIS